MDVEPVADVPGIDEGIEEVVEEAELIILKAAAKVCGFGVGEDSGKAWGELGDGDVCARDFKDYSAVVCSAVLLEPQGGCRFACAEGSCGNAGPPGDRALDGCPACSGAAGGHVYFDFGGGSGDDNAVGGHFEGERRYARDGADQSGDAFRWEREAEGTRG